MTYLGTPWIDSRCLMHPFARSLPFAGPQDSISSVAGAETASRPQNAPAAIMESWRGASPSGIPSFAEMFD
jgi:hypothetical protein